MKRTKLRVKGISTPAQLKNDIQALVREIVIIRDGGCIFRNESWHNCNGFAKDGHLILQADHLVSRSNAGTFSDTRLIVCVCKGAHGWKSVGNNLRKKEYDERVRAILSPERVELWDRAEAENHAHKTHKMDWAMEKLALERELAKLKEI